MTSKLLRYLLDAFFLSMLIYIILINMPAHAQTSRLYYAGYLGLSMQSESDFSYERGGQAGDYETNNALSFSSALGLRIDRKWRVEAEFSHRKHTMDRLDLAGSGTFESGGDISTNFYLLNLYHDFEYRWRELQPFVSVGLGIATHSVDINDTTGLMPDTVGDSSNFAWQFGGGVKYRMKPNLALTGSYRLLGSTDMDLSGFVLDYNVHELLVGVEYDIPVERVRQIFRP
jgi:opacity protein-like surface antigen